MYCRFYCLLASTYRSALHQSRPACTTAQMRLVKARHNRLFAQGEVSASLRRDEGCGVTLGVGQINAFLRF